MWNWVRGYESEKRERRERNFIFFLILCKTPFLWSFNDIYILEFFFIFDFLFMIQSKILETINGIRALGCRLDQFVWFSLVKSFRDSGCLLDF